MAVVKQVKKKSISVNAIIAILGVATVLFIMLAGGKWAVVGVLAGLIAGIVAGYKLAKIEKKE